MQIKSNSSSNIWSVVSYLGSAMVFIFLLLPASTQAQTSGSSTLPMFGANKEAIEAMNAAQDKREEKSSCKSAADAAINALNQAHEVCQKAGGTDKSSCEEKSKMCSELDEKEQDSNTLGSTFSTLARSFGVNYNSEPDNDGNYRGLCMARTDFKQERDDLKRDLEKAEDRMTKLQTEIAEAQEKQAKDGKKAQDDIRDITKKGREDDQKEAEETRKRNEEQQANGVQTRDQIQKIKGDILKNQGVLAKALAERTSVLLKLTDNMIKTNCLEQMEKIQKAETKQMSNSAGYAAQTGTIRRNRRNVAMGNCIKEALAIRESTRTQTQTQIDAIQNDIEADTKKMQGLEEALNLRNQNLATQAQEAMNNKTAAQQERMQAMQAIQQQNQSSGQISSTKLQEFKKRLEEEEKKKNEYSNRLGSLGTKPAGEKAPDEAIAKYKNADSLLAICKSRCNDSCPGVDGGTSKSTTAPSATTTPKK